MQKNEQILGVNYWKRLQKEKSEIIGNLHGVIILIHNSAEFSQIIDFLNQVKPGVQQRLLYISLVNSWLNIKKNLDHHPIDKKDLFVVDCVSLFLGEVEDTEQCSFRKPPHDLKSLKQLLLENVQRVNPNVLVVDSLSQFINFSMPTEEELKEFYFFLRDIQEKISGLSDDAVILLYDDMFGSLRSLPIMNVDLILKYEVIREHVLWKD